MCYLVLKSLPFAVIGVSRFDRLLLGSEDVEPQPEVLVDKEGFPLRCHNLWMFPESHTERIYNYQLSSARMIMENTFGILSAHVYSRCAINTNYILNIPIKTVHFKGIIKPYN